MKILLVSANQEFLPDPVFPLGIAYLCAALDVSPHPYAVLDLCFSKDYRSDLENALKDFEPQAVGLSLRNIDNVAWPHSISYLPFYRELIETIRRESPAKIVLGGAGFNLMPRELLEHLRADFGVAGDGEETLVRLLDAMDQGLPADGVPGTLTRDASAERAVPPQRTDFARSVPPNRKYLGIDDYLRFGGMGSVQTKRGCVFSCTYCNYPLIQGRHVRTRPPAEVADEIEGLLEQGIDTLFMVDNTFNYPMRHAHGICEEIVRRKLEVRWSCYMHPRYLDRELVDVMKKAGCTGVEFGTDSGSDRLLRRLGKSIDSNDVRRASELCEQAELPFCHALLFGVPGETEETIQETFRLMEQTRPTAVIAMAGVRVFPGTPLYNTIPGEKLLFEGDSILQPAFYVEPEVREFLVERLGEHAAQHKNWILPGLDVNIDPAIQRKLRRIGVKGPLWEHMRHARKRRVM
jgi:radical SAM superfamily enzyme YgiQ (UPF0313 family)